MGSFKGLKQLVLTMKRDLGRNPELAHENWDRLLPKFKKYLHGNHLVGPIPSELGNMSKLSYLQLNNNQLVGGIPSELGNLDQLFELDMSFNKLCDAIPEELDQLQNIVSFEETVCLGEEAIPGG